MPPGKVHAQIRRECSLIAYGLILATAFILFPWIGWWSIVFIAFAILGYENEDMWSPDLDEVGITDNEGLMMKNFKFFGSILAAYWLPYAYLMRFVGIGGRRGHRNFFSHFPYVGTAIRVVYQFWPIYFLPWYSATADAVIGLFFLGMWFGLGTGDLWHYLADGGWIKP